MVMTRTDIRLWPNLIYKHVIVLDLTTLLKIKQVNLLSILFKSAHEDFA